MNNLVIIRETVDKDLEECIRLLRENYDDEIWQHKWSYNNGKRYLENCFNNSNFVSYVVEISGLVKGAIFCHVRPWWDNDELFIDELLIAEEIIDDGYDIKLLNMVEEFAIENELGGIILGTKKNSVGAKFYKKNGFSISKDLQIMRKES